MCFFVVESPRHGQPCLTKGVTLEFPSDLKLLTPKEEETAWKKAVKAAKTCINILSSKDEEEINSLFMHIGDIVPAIANEMRKGDYLESIYPTQLKNVVNAAEGDVTRFICSQLMHSMGKKVTKITDLELNEFPDLEARIIFEPWLNTCLTQKTLISFNLDAAALVKTLGWHNFDSGDIHIFISPESTEFMVYLALVHELVHHISLYSFGNANKNTNNSTKLKRMGIKTVEALTQIITNHIVETNYDLRKDLKGLPSKKNLTKELEKHYPYEIKTLQDYEDHLKRNNLSVSDLISALLSDVGKLNKVEEAMFLQFINLECLNAFVENYISAHWNPSVFFSKFASLRRALARAREKTI